MEKESHTGSFDPGIAKTTGRLKEALRFFCLSSAILFFFSLAVYPQPNSSPSGQDPLLRKSWIPEAQKRESLFRNRLKNSLSTNTYFRILTDYYGREYRYFRDGRVEFNLSSSYSPVFPRFDQLDVHQSEAKEIYEAGRMLDSIRLLKGIEYCERKAHPERIVESQRKAGELLNQIMREKGPDTDDLRILTEPYGCVDKKETFIESAVWGYHFELDSDFRYIFPTSVGEVSGEEDTYKWQIAQFYKSYPPNEWVGSDPFARAYFLQNNRLSFYPTDKLILTIGMTFHPITKVYTPGNYYLLWDLRRGINKSTIREWNFKRSADKDSYVSRATLTTPKGKKRQYFIREKYFLRGNRGFFFSLSYPTAYKDEGNRVWEFFLDSLKVR